MKVIDILNKIANGEEVKFKILSEDEIYRYDYYSQICCDTNDKICEWGIDYRWLNDEVEIIEDKKIPEKIDQNDKEWHYLHNTKKATEEVADNLEHLRQKVNEIIDYLEEKE